jgi:hypothetical protein
MDGSQTMPPTVLRELLSDQTRRRGFDREPAGFRPGVASYPSHGIEPTEILTKAREALEKAVNNADLPGLGLVIVAPQRPL